MVLLSAQGARAAMFRQLAAQYRYIIEIATAGSHDEESAVVEAATYQFEFDLDVLLDGFERLHRQGWSSTDPRRGTRAAG